MATYTKPALSPQTFEQLVQQLKANDSERRRAIEIIQTSGALAFGEEYFSLTDKQRSQLVEATSKPDAAFKWQALLSQGLAQGVPMVIDPTTTQSIIDITVHVGSQGDIDVSVHINCPI
ncbi:hypothetical protein ABZY16_32735 [Streptomyces sp. NPDC006553]|uniref:hypothetical protein n=1 Tax=unclassified Streptomyces TaxID=2593676 RepID=UPI002258859E|nr:hypothetical protein [Streptomyces sp. NBC_00233]MCX5232664.1 hypothetical protein [Streptomyces sp. NBC_00233]